MSIDKISPRKNLFSSASFCWKSGLSLHTMDRENKFGGNIVHGESYLEFIYRHFKVFRLPAKQHDAAGDVRAHSGKNSEYCHMILRRPSSCFLNWTTPLPLRMTLSSSFNSFDF